MPLILQVEEKDKFSYAIWHIDEDLSFFLNKISLFDSEKSEIENWNHNRVLEWVSSRYLLSLLENKLNRSECIKDKYGKPFLKDSKLFISLSHSGKYIAAAISNVEIGVDIQKITKKVLVIKNKFLSKIELLYCTDDIQCLNRMWTAKEAIYKAYGKKRLNFIENISIDKFILNSNTIYSKGIVQKDNFIQNYNLISKNINDAIMTLAVKNLKDEK